MKRGFEGDPTNKQEVFDFVYRYMTKQRRPAVESAELGGCRYRIISDGSVRACAAGCLMSDADYFKFMEDALPLVTWGPIRPGADGISKYFGDRGFDLVFLRELQRAHDSSSFDVFVDDFQCGMKEIAANHGLTIPTIED